MILNKEQITFIDNYLINKNVKYWDIRLEMIDHVATKVEQNEGLELDEEFLKEEFGPCYQISKMINEKKRYINKKYRNLLFKEISTFFKSTKNSIMFLLFFLLYYKSYQLLDAQSFKRISLMVLFIPIGISIFFLVRDLFSFKKSIHLEYAFSWMTVSFIFINLMMQLTKPNGIYFNVPTQIQPIVVLITLPFYLVFMYYGYEVYRSTQKTYSKIYNEYKSVCN